jgi:hypothetical protein
LSGSTSTAYAIWLPPGDQARPPMSRGPRTSSRASPGPSAGRTNIPAGLTRSERKAICRPSGDQRPARFDSPLEVSWRAFAPSRSQDQSWLTRFFFSPAV